MLPAVAQTYPSRPIRMIVPIAPGSVTDVAARLMAQELTDRMGQPVIVENRPGANMVIGGAECAKAAPDGYTLCVVSPDTMSFNPFTIPNLPYDPDRDFRPVTNMYYVIEGLVAKQALPANSVAELRTLAAARPGALNFGTLGARTTTDMYRLWLGELWKTSFVGVPYKGGSEIIGALLTGTIDVSKIGVGNMAGQLDGRKTQGPGLAQPGPQRAPAECADPRRGRPCGLPGRPDFLGHDGAGRDPGRPRQTAPFRTGGGHPRSEVHGVRASAVRRTGRLEPRAVRGVPQGGPRQRRQIAEVLCGGEVDQRGCVARMSEAQSGKHR